MFLKQKWTESDEFAVIKLCTEIIFWEKFAFKTFPSPKGKYIES